MVVLELKSVSKVTPEHVAQFLTYVKLSKRPVGLMINFNVTRLRHGIKRVVNNFVA
jgi:GxxExxY protein